MSPELDIDALLDDRHTQIIVCCGSGGVGKTTTAAALALRAAERGRVVVVMTIDPARRLAQSLGLERLDDVPRSVPGTDSTAGGRLDAMTLDMKRTFDGVVTAHATPERAEQILANPFYRALSSSFAGTQEYMAMEKLGQLHESGTWDLVVVDTPPSRSALDFLDAPQRLSAFLDGRFLRLLTAPAGVGGRFYARALGAGVSAVTGVLSTVLGTQVLNDVQVFVSGLESMFGGFRERAAKTYARLADPGTAFVVVAAPEPDALREATYFLERLAADDMPLAGVLVNRVHGTAAPQLTAAQAREAAELLAGRPEHRSAHDALVLHADWATLAEREARLVDGFAAAHPGVALATIAARTLDVHDLAGLRAIPQPDEPEDEMTDQVADHEAYVAEHDVELPSAPRRAR